mgnify:CR=1 FL=1
MKSIFLLIAVVVFSITANANTDSITTPLDSIYNDLLRKPNAEVRKVMFTGSDMSKAGGFRWQRGEGTGWTRGRRVMVEGVSRQQAIAIDDIFKKIARNNFVIRYDDNSSATLIEPSNTVYIYEYKPDDSRLYFLKASTTGEICVPLIWTSADSVNATKYNPLAFASNAEIAQLGLSKLWSAAKRNFVFMNRVTVNWDSLYVANMRPVAEAAEAGDDKRVEELLQLMAARLGDGHTYVYGNNSYKCTTPIATVLIDGHVYVDSVAGIMSEGQELTRGMELVSINGIDAVDYGRKYIMPYISSSTPQWSDAKTFDGYRLLEAAEGDTLRMRFKRGVDSFEVDYVAGSVPFHAPHSQAINYSQLSDGIGLLRISNFMDDNFKQQFDRIYPDMLTSKSLIIDLRGNDGGNSGNGDYILRHLADSMITTSPWSSPAYIPAYASWGMEQPVYTSESGTMAPYTDRPIYDRPIVLLVDRGTFSAAEDFTVIFRGMGRGLIIGTPTGGSTGNGVRVTLIPGKAYANICSKHDIAPDGTEFVGIGIIPDIEVVETYDSHFGSAGSAVLAAARRVLSTNVESPSH